MKKQNYEVPEMEIVVFNELDVITVSGLTDIETGHDDELDFNGEW